MSILCVHALGIVHIMFDLLWRVHRIVFGTLILPVMVGCSSLKDVTGSVMILEQSIELSQR